MKKEVPKAPPVLNAVVDVVLKYRPQKKRKKLKRKSVKFIRADYSGVSKPAPKAKKVGKK